MSLHISKTKKGKAHIMRFCGNLDILDSREIPSRLIPFTRSHYGKIVLDLSESSFVDSQWLAVFIRFSELAKQHKNELIFCIPPGTVFDLFDSVGLTKIFNVVNSLDMLD